MTDTPPPSDPTRTLGQFALGALGLIVAAALLFLLIGAVSGDDGGEPVASPSTTTPTTSAPSAPATTTPPTEPSPTATGETTTATPSPSASPTLAVDPASVSVQVLDGVLDDNGATADDVAAELETAGYRVIAQNRAVRSYDQTTVFYTDGNEAAAQQIADTFGYDVVGQAPANLNQSVAIHIVVGRDA